MKFVIPGGSGQVGQILARHFMQQGHDVVVFSRREMHGAIGRFVAWDGKSLGAWCVELDGADVLINLAGYTVNCRYNQTNRLRIMDSRVDSTRVLREAMSAVKRPPALWMNASTATIYRHALDRPMDEESGESGGNEPGAPEKWKFSIAVAKAWEKEFFAFDVMLGLVRTGLGGTNASGRQFVSWIHDADFIAAIEFIMQHEELDRAINLVSPNPIPNREFMRTIRQAWGAPIGLPATAWMMEIGAIFMRTETELVLKSRRVVPGRLSKAGFTFRFPQWKDAAKDLCQRVRER